MRIAKTLILGLVAAFALSAVAAASASATLPEFSNYPVKFESKSGKSILEASKEKIECTKDTNKGEITGPKTDVVVVTFEGCTTASGLVECGTKGTIKTNELESELGYINAANKEVGLSLKPKTSGGLFAEFECAGVKIKVKGSIIGKITPVNTLTSTFELVFKCVSGKQEIEKFEGGLTDVLEVEKGGKLEEGCETSTDTITTATAGEIKA